MFKYRLYELDVVINKTLSTSGWSGFITAVYVAIVVGIGSLVGSGDQANVPLSIAATAIVAVAFQPVRERVQRFANRLVYGQRATPYEVLSEFSERIGDAYDAEDLSPGWRGSSRRRRARSAATYGSWSAADSARRVVARGRRPAPTRSRSNRSPSNWSRCVIRTSCSAHSRWRSAPGNRSPPPSRSLVEHLAGQAGLVLRNVRLTEELLAPSRGAAGFSAALGRGAGRGTAKARAEYP